MVERSEASIVRIMEGSNPFGVERGVQFDPTPHAGQAGFHSAVNTAPATRRRAQRIIWREVPDPAGSDVREAR